MCGGVIKDGTVKLFSWEKEKEQLQTQCQSQGHCVLGDGDRGGWWGSQLPPISPPNYICPIYSLYPSVAFFFSLHETTESNPQFMKISITALLSCWLPPHSFTSKTLLAVAECNLFEAACLFLSVGIIWPHSDKMDANATAYMCVRWYTVGGGCGCPKLHDINTGSRS